jgi:hypothetical protein
MCLGIWYFRKHNSNHGLICLGAAFAIWAAEFGFGVDPLTTLPGYSYLQSHGVIAVIVVVIGIIISLWGLKIMFLGSTPKGTSRTGERVNKAISAKERTSSTTTTQVSRPVSTTRVAPPKKDGYW